MGRFGGRSREESEDRSRPRRRGVYSDDEDKRAEAEQADAKPRLRSVITGVDVAAQEQGPHRHRQESRRESSRRKEEASAIPDAQLAPWEVPRGKHWGVSTTYCQASALPRQLLLQAAATVTAVAAPQCHCLPSMLCVCAGK